MEIKEVSVFKTMRHIETVRNYLNSVVKELLKRGERHDQTKLQSPEVETFDVYTAKLKHTTYGSPEYKKYLDEMKPALTHHNTNNRHHPEHHPDGIKGMTLVDLMEMLCDWKAATLRHNDGDILKSIEINQKRFGYSDELKSIMLNTATWLNEQEVTHYAEES